jgi:hypothetical protein
MKKLISIIFLSLLTACSTLPQSVNGQLQTAYNTVSAYVDVTKNGLVRGRLSAEQAEKASANAKKAQNTIDQAKTALVLCKEQLPCEGYTDLLKSLQPSLLEFELELRKQQGQVK